jgi:hypothetical protein
MPIGQVSGVAIASAVFQSILDRELTLRITGPGSEDVSPISSFHLHFAVIGIMTLRQTIFAVNPSYPSLVTPCRATSSRYSKSRGRFLRY